MVWCVCMLRRAPCVGQVRREGGRESEAPNAYCKRGGWSAREREGRGHGERPTRARVWPSITLSSHTRTRHPSRAPGFSPTHARPSPCARARARRAKGKEPEEGGPRPGTGCPHHHHVRAVVVNSPPPPPLSPHPLSHSRGLPMNALVTFMTRTASALSSARAESCERSHITTRTWPAPPPWPPRPPPRPSPPPPRAPARPGPAAGGPRTCAGPRPRPRCRPARRARPGSA